MYVKDKMSKNLYTTYKDVSISNALDIMSKYSLHRLPVVDKENNLIGLLTKSMISKNSPNDATSLSVFELNYLLNKLTVEDVMVKDVVTISKDALLEEAASTMRQKDVGCLPVIEDKKLIGIITYNDIFDAFIDLLGYHLKGTRYVINISEDKVGVMEKISKCFREEDISISNLAVYNTERGIEVVVIATGKGSDKAKDLLEKRGYKVTSVINLKK